MSSLSKRELDDLKPLLDKAVHNFLGFSEPTLATAALNCLDQGYDKHKTTVQLTAILDDVQAHEFVDRLYSLWEDYDASNREARKRKKEQNEGDERIKKRRFMDDDSGEVDPPIPVILTAEQIRETMANARMMIMERKAQLVPPPISQARHENLYDSAALKQEAVEKAKRAAQLGAQIQARLASAGLSQLPQLANLTHLGTGPTGGLNNVPSLPKIIQPSKPVPLILDEEGRTIDIQTGQTVQIQQYKPTLKANIHAKRREEFKGIIEKPLEEITETKYFDARVSLKAARRTKRGFKFHEHGKFENLASRLRTKAQLDRLQNEIAQAAKKTGIASAAKLATITPKKELVKDKASEEEKQWKKDWESVSGKGKRNMEAFRLEMMGEMKKTIKDLVPELLRGILPGPDLINKEKEGETPDVEWWDAFVLETDSYPSVNTEDEPSENKFDGITKLIEHPIQMKPHVEASDLNVLPVFLTKKERKKLRRQSRLEAQKEEQEKIRLGLMPPPDAKVRLANLMRVLGSEAVQDPTKVEAHVRAQMAKRQRAHEEANAARKLTAEQRSEKKSKKIQENTSLGVHVAIYRITDLRNPSRKFKIEANINQLHMTGIVVMFKDCNLIAVEGGPKQQKKFKRLMLHRIKWEDIQRGGGSGGGANKDDDDSDTEDVVKVNKCVLAWEGTTKVRAFGEVKFKQCPTESFAREQFRRCGVEHYWDLAYSHTVLEAAGDDDFL